MPGPVSMTPTAGVCNQCGFSHPPVAGKCPMAKEKNAEGVTIDMNDLFTPLRTIAMSQIQKKGIKDIKKLFGYIIIEITKLLENYKE